MSYCNYFYDKLLAAKEYNVQHLIKVAEPFFSGIVYFGICLLFNCFDLKVLLEFIVLVIHINFLINNVNTEINIANKYWM